MIFIQKKILEIERLLYEKVMKINNHDNSCNCEKGVGYDFEFLVDPSRTSGPITSFCLNCGGIHGSYGFY